MSLNFNLLTSKQKKVYSAIEAYIQEKSIPPSVREIGEMVGEKTPGAVQGILNRLEQKGVIKREAGIARSIQLVSDHSLYLKPVYVPELKKVNERTIPDLLNLYNIEKYHPISSDIIGANEIYFIITSNDDSLEKLNIGIGDQLILCSSCPLKDGDVVCILYQNRTFLRIYHPSELDDKVLLTAEANSLSKELFSRSEIIIVGKLVGKYNKY